MKQILISASLKKSRRFILFAGLMVLLLTPAGLFAQTDTTKTTATEEPAAAEESSLISPTIEFISVQKSNNTIDLKASLRAKIKGSLTKLHSLKVRFYLMNDTMEQELGAVNADMKGVALLNVKADAITPDKEGKLHFKAVVAGNKSMEGANEELTIKRAILTITPVKEDSLLSVSVKLVDMVSGVETPVKEAVIGIFVTRLFNPLKVVEATTDENGEASVEFPANLPGDAKGNLTLLARLDESEVYGNLEASSEQKWGVPVSNLNEEQPRALWSSHPPMWMLITFIVLMVTVWGHYIVIIYELFRLRKEQPHAPVDATNP